MPIDRVSFRRVVQVVWWRGRSPDIGRTGRVRRNSWRMPRIEFFGKAFIFNHGDRITGAVR